MGFANTNRTPIAALQHESPGFERDFFLLTGCPVPPILGQCPSITTTRTRKNNKNRLVVLGISLETNRVANNDRRNAMQLTEKHVDYWRKNLRVTAILLFIWFVSTFVMAFFARELASTVIFGWPLSFYMAAQGSLIIYVLIIGFYARYMRQLDIDHDVAEGEE
jgi:putative solute:sodium symporter small subunit